MPFYENILEEGPAKRLNPIDFSLNVAADAIDDEYILDTSDKVDLHSNAPTSKGNNYKFELIDTRKMS